MATTIQASDTGRLARYLPHSPSKIWQALIQNAELGEHGALLRCPPAPISTPCVATITAYESKKRLECSWGGRRLCWELEARNDKTLVTFSHDCGEPDSKPWLACLDPLH
jgi:hypothetical protein